MIPNTTILLEFKTILEKYGDDLTAEGYDALKIDKPSRGLLRERLGPWKEAKCKALKAIDIEQDEQREKLSNQYLIKQIDVLRKEIEKERNRNAILIENCMTSISKVSFSPVNIPSPEKVKHNLEFHALKSDDHAGEVIDPVWVQGISEYNSELFEKRMKIWTEKVAIFREQDKASLGLNKLVIYMLGDHVNGESIFNGQQFYIDSSLTDQLLTCIHVYANCILTLAETFPKIEIFTVIGNHGRPGKKGDNHRRTNFDYLFFRFLQTALKQQENIKMYVNESPTMIVQHGDFNFALNHGDAAQSWMGIPYYGLDRLSRKLDSLYGITIDYKLFGHFHQPANMADTIILNGTMVGGSDLSINKMGLSNVASQKIFYFDRRHGINRESNLYLTKPITLEPDQNGIYTTYTK